MKKVKLTLVAIMGMLATITVPLAPLVLVGCTGGCAHVQEGQSTVVVRAEQVAAASFELMDAFVTMEENNREYLRTVSPEIEKAANSVRTEGKAAIEALRSATKAYKENRTPENEADVNTWIRTVEQFKAIAVKYLTSKKTAPSSAPSSAPAPGK